MTLESFEQHENQLQQVDPAAKRDVSPRTCVARGYAAIGAGLVSALVMYTLVAGGNEIHPDLARGVNTFAVGTVVCGLMGVLAGKIMNRVEAGLREIAELRMLLADSDDGPRQGQPRAPRQRRARGRQAGDRIAGEFKAYLASQRDRNRDNGPPTVA